MLFFGSIACTGQVEQKVVTSSAAPKVEVFYFHFTRRCNTCQSVEKNAKLAVESLYADKIKAGEFSFAGFNLDDESSKALAEKLGVGGQSLLVVKGAKKIDITGLGFMNAQDLDRMKVEIKKAVDSL